VRIVFEGKPKKISLKKCRQALHFFASILFPRRINTRLPLVVKFIPGYLKKEDCKGATDWVEADAPLFSFELDDNLSSRETLKVIAHELVHVKQMRLGELVETNHASKFLYKNKSFDIAKIDYWDLPHEIEAYGREVGLYTRYHDIVVKKRKK
jgi:hypothetical protein